MAEAQNDNAKENYDPDKVFISWPTARLVIASPYPGALYLCIGHRMVKYKNAGDALNIEEFDKLVMTRVRYLFIEEPDKDKFTLWASRVSRSEDEADNLGATEEQKPIITAARELRRAALDLFTDPTGDESSKKAIQMSKKMVTEFLKKPFVINNITQLQRYERGCVDHSVNVSVLSVFLGLRMGYSSQVILDHLAMGGLLHDIGKTQMNPSDEKLIDKNDPLFQQHPMLGKAALEATKEITREVANEVRMIVAQHHEYIDGSGYPNRLRGLAVYDLARVVTIANTFDNLVSQAEGSMNERVAQALEILKRDYEGKLDSIKLEKALKIIKTSLA